MNKQQTVSDIRLLAERLEVIAFHLSECIQDTAALAASLDGRKIKSQDIKAANK